MNLPAIILSLACVCVTGCKSKTPSTPSPPVAAKAESEASDSPQWIDVVTDVPTTIAVRPDGRQVIVDAAPFTHVCELPSGKRIHTWPHRVQAFYSGDGKSVLTVSDSVALVSDTTSFRIQQTFPSPSRPPTPTRWLRNRPTPHSSAISFDGKRIALTDLFDASDPNSPGVVRIFDSTSGTEVFSLLPPVEAKVDRLDFLSNGARLLARYRKLGKQGPGQLWDIDRSKMITEFPAGSEIIVSKKKDFIAVGAVGQEINVTIHDAETGALQNHLKHTDILNDFTFRPDSKQLLIARSTARGPQASADQSDSTLPKRPVSRVTQWEIATAKITFEHTHDEFRFSGVMYDVEGNRMFAALAKPTGVDDDVDYFLSGWNTKTLAPIKTLPQAFFVYEVGEAFFLPGSNDAILLGKRLSVRDIVTGKEVSPVDRYRVAQKRVRFKADSHCIYTTGSAIDLQAGVSTPSFPMGLLGEFTEGGKAFLNIQHPSLSLIDSKTRQQFWNLYLECAGYAAHDSTITSNADCIVRSQPIRDLSASRSRVLIIRPDEPNSPKILHRYASRVVVHSSNQMFAAASDRSIEELEIATGQLSRKTGDVPGRVLDMAYFANGTQIAACGVMGHHDPQEYFLNSSQGWVWLFDCETQQVRKLRGHTAVVTSVAIDAARNRMATSSHDGTVRLWDTKTAECLHVYRGHHGEIDRVDVSSDGRLLVSAGADGIAVWNIANVVDANVAAVEIASKLTFDESRQNSYPAANRGNANSPNSRERISPAEGSGDWDVVKVGDTSRVHFNNRSVDLWLKENRPNHTEARVNQVVRPKSEVSSSFGHPFSKSTDGKRLLFIESREPTLKVLGSDYEEIQSWPIQASERTAVISPDGEHVFILREDRRESATKVGIDIYDVRSGDLLRTIPMPDANWGNNLKIDPLGRTILVQFNNSCLDLREINSGESLGVLESPRSGAGRNAEYSPNGRVIAISKYPDPEILLFDPLTLKPIQAITNDLPVRWFKFTPDGSRLLVGQVYARSRTLLTMWQIDRSETTAARRLWSHAGPAGEMGTFSDDGHHYLSPANWNMWTLWDTENGQVNVAIITSGSNVKDQFKLSADGQSIHAYSHDGTLVWRKPDLDDRPLPESE